MSAVSTPWAQALAPLAMIHPNTARRATEIPGLKRVDAAGTPPVHCVSDFAGSVDAGKVVGRFDVYLVEAEVVAQLQSYFAGEEVAACKPRLYHACLDVVDLEVDRPQVAFQV